MGGNKPRNSQRLPPPPTDEEVEAIADSFLAPEPLAAEQFGAAKPSPPVSTSAPAQPQFTATYGVQPLVSSDATSTQQLTAEQFHKLQELEERLARVLYYNRQQQTRRLIDKRYPNLRMQAAMYHGFVQRRGESHAAMMKRQRKRSQLPIWLTDEPLDTPPPSEHQAADACPAKAVLQAQTDGLVLERSDRNATGFEGVTRDPVSLRFKASTSKGIGDLRDTILGWFNTAEEAAVERAEWKVNISSDSRLTLCEFKARKG